jgi:hypothetical protein
MSSDAAQAPGDASGRLAEKAAAADNAPAQVNGAGTF